MLADEQKRTILSRLPPAERAKVVMALLGLVILGLAVVALIAIGARWYRRSNAPAGDGQTAQQQDAWARKPLNRNEPDTDGNDNRPSDDPTDGTGG